MANTPKEEHPSQKPFGELLAQFVGSSKGEVDTFQDGDFSISPALIQQISQDKRKRGKKKGTFEGVDLDDRPAAELDDLSELMGGDDDDYDELFDDLIEEAFIEDENVTLRNNLISLGRKYTIKGMEEEGESSEVNKSFARQEQAIGALLDEINADASALQRDIELLRGSRTKSYKSMADLIAAKVSMSNAKLAAIKELSSIQKTKYEINMKLKKDKDTDAGDTGMAATQAVQRLLSVGRGNLMPSDDYEESYSARGDDSPGGASYDDGRPETAIRLAADLPEAVSDGDKFIQHESEGVEFVLDIDSETDRKQIYAINKYGSVVPDYPLPSNPEQLQFQLNEMAGEATDQLQRRYLMRRDGRDVIEREYCDHEDPYEG
jgi:hypothetical protein